MNTPAPKTSPDAALGNLMAAVLNVPAAPEQPAVPDDTLARTGNTADHQAGWFAGMEQGQANAKDNAAIHTRAQEYGAPAEVAQRIEQYIGRYGREDTATLLLYEAMNALRRHAPAAGDARDAAVGAAIGRACAELPFGYSIELSLEGGYGGARLIDPEDRETELDQDERDLATEINAGIDAAIAAQQGRK
ncbi:hypothetical protein [Achromobacter xylosoxidans]|uniref:hypothetical protein n=1 Tax=Alcaligenes xylosoxydans xylosoxydans TaxID=85698 RepID=UPI000DA30AE7|nr:hypothetical protein [Achromobacter xylosoxidans]SQG75733.1 Uncharacterised protein [Achromobacter xylosoxidans]